MHMLRDCWQVNKLKGQEYQLLWKEQPDFVRMAAKLNAVIIPFAAVGGKCFISHNPACHIYPAYDMSASEKGATGAKMLKWVLLNQG